jgi:putative phosphoesterase
MRERATLALLADIHANAAALEAVLADLAERRIPEVYCLGDLVGYGPEPNEVVSLLRDAGIACVRGNYDDGVGFRRGSCGCFYADDEVRAIGEASYAYTDDEVSDDNREWLASLPDELRLELVGWRVRLVHGSPRRINEYLLADRDERTYHRLAREADAAILAFGHTHQTWHRVYDGVMFLNVGSVGRPKDGDPRAAYTLLRLDEGGPRVGKGMVLVAGASVEVVRVPYDVERTVRGVLAARLPGPLAYSFMIGR